MTETIGQNIDAKVALVEAKVAKLEAAAKTDWSKFKGWLGSNWPHFVTWAGAAAGAVKLGLVKFV